MWASPFRTAVWLLSTGFGSSALAAAFKFFKGLGDDPLLENSRVNIETSY